MEKEDENVGPYSRPLSYYDNSKQSSSNNNIKECKFSESLTQLHCLNTTVPQNIVKQDIGGKHTPTRSSLRHSRMVVLNKSGQVTSNNTPIFIKYRKFVKSIMILTILLGFSLCIASLWLHVWTPNLESKYAWSALLILISGSIGVMFINSCPEVYNRHVSFCIRSVKYISIGASTLAATASLIIFIFSVILIITLFTMECVSFEANHDTCICHIKSSNETTSFSYHYVDLNCHEVKHILPGLISYIGLTNIIVTAIKLVYLYLHWASRNVYIYTRVSVNENAPTIEETNR